MAAKCGTGIADWSARFAFLGMGQVDLDRGSYFRHAYGVGSGYFVVCGGKVRPPGTKRSPGDVGTEATRLPWMALCRVWLS